MFVATVPHRAQPPLSFLPPNFNPKIHFLSKGLLPSWMRLRTGIQSIEVDGVETLVHLFKAFQAKQIRFLIAFRHPSPEDAFCLAHLLWYEVPRVAQRLRIPLDKPVHAHFLYDRGIPLWAGRGVGWLYSQLGGTPIRRSGLDREGLRSARRLFAQGRFPMVAAPEGANNGHTEIVSPLEPGVAQLGFWCVEDLRRANRTESVVILPLGIQYRYLQPPWSSLRRLMRELETEAGLQHQDQSSYSWSALQSVVAPSAPLSAEMQALYPRLMGLGTHLLSLMETYYSNFFQAPRREASADLAERLHNLLDAALQVAEAFFHLSPRGSIIDRCRRIEQSGWDWIYREELRDRHALSPVERGLADRIAEEAALRMWHMRLVESFVAVTGHYVREKPTAERFAETLLLLHDTIMRLEGKNPFPRPQLGKQRVHLTVGQPISVSDRWPAYRQQRRAAVTQLTQDLQTALESLLPHAAGFS